MEITSTPYKLGAALGNVGPRTPEIAERTVYSRGFPSIWKSTPYWHEQVIGTVRESFRDKARLMDHRFIKDMVILLRSIYSLRQEDFAGHQRTNLRQPLLLSAEDKFEIRNLRKKLEKVTAFRDLQAIEDIRTFITSASQQLEEIGVLKPE